MLRRVLLAFLMVAFLGSMAWAVEVNPGGKGDALIMGYYNARNALTYFRMVNTSDMLVVAKMRFREGKRSEEVLDFVVCMSPYDEFSVLLMDGGQNVPAKLYRGSDMISDSDSVTVPGTWTEVSLRYGATGAAPTVTIDDTKEGYVEFIALSAVEGLEKITSAQCKDLAEVGYITIGENTYSIVDAPNVLFGSVEIVKLDDALPIFSYKATALMDTTDQGFTIADATGKDLPLFDDLLANDGGISALNAVLAKSAFYGMYDLRADLGADTDFVITFPTKMETWQASGKSYNPPLSDIWSVVVSNNPSDANDRINYCVTVKFDVYDDKEQTIAQTIDFSPYEKQTNTLPYEVNYLTIGGPPSVLNTSLSTVNIETGGFNFGWVKIYFENNNDDYVPALGYELQTWVNSVLSRMVEMSYDANME